MEQADLIGKIVEIAGNYRKGEIVRFDEKHVERWIGQFEVSEKDKTVILNEVAHMLGNFYFSRENAKTWLTRLFEVMKEERAAGCSIRNVNFLRTQEAGKSQYDLLLIADEILQERMGISTRDCGGSNIFLYIDDCVYSGNKWRYDIKNSSQLAGASQGLRLITYHFALHSKGFTYAKPFVEYEATRRGGVLKPFRREWLLNDREADETMDVIWPTYEKGNKFVDKFVSYSNAQNAMRGWMSRPLFRKNQRVSEKIFTCVENQHIVEQAFLRVGAKLFGAALNPAKSMRPMGFEVISTIGFGTPIVTWRNIPNNAPLALWYGDPASYGPNHPLGMWYPLFPRKA